MEYTVITKTGKVMTFFIKAVAETFVTAYGGVMIDNSVVTEIEGNMTFTRVRVLSTAQ